MRATSVALVFTLACAPCGAAENPRPVGPNCALSAPPANSGEESNHGAILRVFPRARDINSKYSGCQALFAEHKGQWVVVSVTEVVQGDPVRVWSEQSLDDDSLFCRYSRGKVVRGNPETCPMPDFILLKSLAPGCAQRIREAVINRGVGAPMPEGCKYE